VTDDGVPLQEFFKELEAKCSCGRVVILTFKYGNNLKPGDKLWSDPGNPNFGRCPACKRTNMIVQRVAEIPPSPGEPHPGFWKPPTGGDSIG
jgi:hypothetical protein